MAAATVAMALTANGGNGGGRQRWPKRRQHKGRQQSTKKWQQRCSKYDIKCNILNITRLWWKEQGAGGSGCSDSGNGINSQRRQRRGQATRADNNQPKSGRNSSRNGAGGGRDGGSHGSGSGNGVTVAMVATTRQPWQRDGGANMAPTVAEGAADLGGGHLL